MNEKQKGYAQHKVIKPPARRSNNMLQLEEKYFYNPECGNFQGGLIT